MDDTLRRVIDDARRVEGAPGRDVLARARAFDHADRARALGMYPFFRPIEELEGAEAVVEGRPVLMFGSNNYLGLTTHPEVRRAAIQAIDRYGTGVTGSRLLSGTLPIHTALERRLAEFLGKQACVVFTTGHQASLAALQSLGARDAALVLDQHAHASLFDGARLAEAMSYTFRHNDPEHLERVLGRLGERQGALVVLEGVYSMGGDLSPLPALVDVARRHGARLLLDDAHGVGVLGRGGRGTADHFDLGNETDLILGTFSKSLASSGGFLAGDARVIDFVGHFGRSFLFTAALPPASTAAGLAALELLEREPERIGRLRDNARSYRVALRAAGFDVTDALTPIVPIAVGDESLAAESWRALLDAGLYVNAAIFPAVPRGRAILRTSVMATHTEGQIARAVEILASVLREP